VKAIVYHDYGPPDVLQCEEVEKPVAGDDEVLIRIRAASLNPRDVYFMRGVPYAIRIMTGLKQPEKTSLGADLAGQVEAVGRNVKQFQPGDEVFGAALGAFSEYICAKPADLAIKPANLTFEQAAAVPTAGLTALQGLRDTGRVQPGHKVLINGAAGGVGTFAVQIAKAFGADVTAVCSTRTVDMVRSIGADHVIDYTQEDFTRSGRQYDLMFDVVSNHSLSACRRILGSNGTLVIAGGSSKGKWLGPLLPVLTATVMSRFVSQTLAPLLTKFSQHNLIAMQALLAAGKVTPVIDRSYPLSEVAEAMRYLAEGHARGKVVISLP
jgi:NADPH:quinone reductase-like Zn-dependent oxidoreductase